MDDIMLLSDLMYIRIVHEQEKIVISTRWFEQTRSQGAALENSKFCCLMDCRYYRVPDPEPYDGKYLRSCRVRNSVTLKLHMSDKILSRDPPALVFDFLDRYRDECIGID